MNLLSSRSHTVLQVIVEQREREESGSEVPSASVVRSKVNFVDLAGSERWNTKLELSEERISEITFINSSLSALSSVVAALGDGAQHVPYR